VFFTSLPIMIVAYEQINLLPVKYCILRSLAEMTNFDTIFHFCHCGVSCTFFYVYFSD
jgi:hypothetical protein